MSLNLISRGIIINFILKAVTIMFLIKYSFELENQTFTALLLLILFLTTLYVGIVSKLSNEHAQINGLFTGVGSALVIFLFLSQFQGLTLSTSIAILFIWMFIGYLGGFLGSKLVRSPKVEKITVSE